MPLIIREVKDAASQAQQAESDVITLLKNTILGRIESRLKTDEIVNTTALLDPTLKSVIMANVGEQDARKYSVITQNVPLKG
jgi:hypothetical protein